MFSKRVVFVVGAGASSEYGLPLGSQLRDGIADDVRFRFDRVRGAQTSGSTELVDVLRILLNGDAAKINRLAAAGDVLAPAMQLFPSVDEALHYFSTDEGVVRLGKLAIANRIIKSERDSQLPTEGNHEAIRSFNAVALGKWLFHLLSLVLRGRQLTDGHPVFENVTIINFNYDRTIEHFLFLALQRNGARTKEDAAAALSQLNFIRPYGTIGSLPWQSQQEQGIPFGGSRDFRSETIAAADSIRTFTEQHEDARMRERLSTALSNASLTIFLGFGFHRQNMEILKIPDTNRHKLILATTRGVHEANNDRIKKTIAGALIKKTIAGALSTESPYIKLFDMQAETLLSELQPMILDAAG